MGQPFGPLLGSAAFSGAAVIEWVTSAPVLLALVALLALGAVAAERLPDDSAWRRTSWRLPAIVAVAGIWGGFFFTHWASGFSFRPGPPNRVANVVFLFTLLTFGGVAFMLGVQKMQGYASLARQLAPAGRWMLPVLVMLLFGQGNVRQAYYDLVVGRASSYDRELNERYAALDQARSLKRAVVAPTLSRIPTTIFFRDIATDPADWRNQCYATFWGVPEVRLQPPSGE